MILDRFNVREELRAGNRRAMRQSMSENADVCLKRLAFDMDPASPKGQSAARAIGTAYHAGMEQLYNGDAHWQDPARTELMQQWTTWPHLHDEMSLSEASTALETMMAAYVPWDHKRYEVIGTEVEWFVPLHDDWVAKGAIDLALVDQHTGAVLLADHKTAGKAWPVNKGKPRKKVQGPLYVWAWWMNTGELPVSFTYDVMTYKGNFERRTYEITSQDMRLALEKVQAVTTVLDRVPADMLPANPSSNLCSERYCDFYSVCPYGGSAAPTAA